MATYTNDFGSYTADAQPSDWTARWVTTNSTFAARTKSGAQGGKTLEHTSTADGRRLLSYNAIDSDANRADAEILVRVRTTGSVGTAALLDQVRSVLRGSGAAGAESCYFLQFSESATGSIRLGKLVSGTQTMLGTAFAMPRWQSNVWYWMRFKVSGTSLSGKIWEDGEKEPTSWQVTATDSSVTGAGWVGVGNFESSGTARDWDFVSIGTGTDAAPLAFSTGTNVRIHQAVTEMLVDPGGAARVSQSLVEVAFGQVVPGFFYQAVVEVAFSTEGAPADAQQPRMFCIT